MYNKILVPMALGHGLSEKTLGIAHKLSNDGASITALHVFETPPGSVSAWLGEDIIEKSFAQSKALLKEKTQHLDGIKTDIIKGQPYRAIVDYATSNGYDCIVIGSHKPGLSDYYIGSTAARVVRHAPCAVHVHRGG